MSMYTNTGRVGRPRGIGLGILLFVVTLGLYGWYWVFKTQEEDRLVREGAGSPQPLLGSQGRFRVRVPPTGFEPVRRP